MALRHSLEQLADAPLAQQEPGLVARIIRRSNELQQSVTGMLERGQRRHLQRNALLSSLYQSQSYLRHLQDINRRFGSNIPDAQQLAEMDRLILAAIDTLTARHPTAAGRRYRNVAPARDAARGESCSARFQR